MKKEFCRKLIDFYKSERTVYNSNMRVISKVRNLYNQCEPISNLSCDTVDYKIFKDYKLVRFCNSKELLKYIPTGDDPRIDAICGFINENPYFWIIPLTTYDENNHYGYVFKSYNTKQYRNVFAENHICSFFGFHNFNDFQKDMPIVLCEGTKDQIVVSSIYKHTLACLTCGLGSDDLKAITNLTKNIILCYDNDKAGINATKRDKERLIKSGCRVVSVFYNSKDPGELFNNPMGLQILRQSLTSILNSY